MKRFRLLAGVCALGIWSASGAVPVIGEDGYDPAKGVIANLDAIVRAVFAETNACIVVTPVPRGLAKGDPARVVSGRVADEVFKLCDNRRKFYLDVRPDFLNRDGSLKAEYYAADGLTLNAAGRDRLAALVRPLAGWIAAPTDEPAPATKFGWKHFYSGNLHLSLAGRPWWWDRVIRNVETAERLRRTRGGRLEVLLIGDSITHHWEDTGASFYAEICDRREVLNLANGGDLPYQQQWLLDNGVVDGLRAKLVQIMIGTNDHDEPEKKFGRIRKLVETVRTKQPEAKIVLCAILPRIAEKDAAEYERNERVNAQLRTLCDGRRTVFLDVGEPMRRALGEPVEQRRKLAGDLLHPSVLMYRHWLECLRPHLPPSASDLQPARHVTAFAVGQTRERGNLALPELDQALAKAALSPRQATHVYLRYRTTCPELAGILYTQGVDDRYHSDFGFWPDGKVHDAVIALEGWSRSGKRLRLDGNASFVFKLGEGEIELIEVGVVLGASAAGERRVVIADFADPAVAGSAWINPWGGEKRGKAEFDGQAGCVRYSFPASNGSAGARLIDRLVRERLTNETGRLTHFYVRYRTDDPKANPSLNQQTAADVYVSVTGFVPDGKVREARIRPAGWSRKNLPFDRHELTSLYFAASDATFEIYEIGAILDPTPVPPVGPEVDTEAFRLYPEPQVFQPGEERFPLAAYAAPQAFGARAGTAVDWFSARVARFYPELRSAHGRRPVVFALAGTAAGQAALGRLKLTKNFGRVKYDGYAFGVRADGIDVVAHNDMGLMNGVRSLMQTIHQASGDAGPARVRALTVVDWPRVEHRMLYIPVYNCALRGLRQEPADYAGLLDRFVFGAHYNLVAFDLGPMYAWACDPTYRPGRTGWTPSDLTNLVDRVNALGGRVVPFVMSPGHMRPALFWYGGHAELMEEGAREALCMGHPQTYATLFARMQEMADVCAHNPGCQAPVFYTGGDEVRWKRGLSYEERCPYCRDTPRSEQLLAHMRKVDAWCRERNYQMLMCSDMYVPAHNGFGPARGALVADRIEKTIALLHWGNMDWDEMELWHRRGHRNWKVMTGYSSDPTGDAYCDGYGFALYTDRWWLTRQRGGGNASTYTPANVFIVGAQGWGPAPATDDEGWRRAQEWGNFWMRNWSRKPIPAGGARFAPVSLRAAANGSVASAHDFATPALSGVPVAFAPPPGRGRVGCVRADGAEHVVTVARKAASLVFLHTGSAAGAVAKGVAVEDGFDQMYGLPVAAWRVAYADGSAETFTVRYGWNVGSRETSVRGANYERYLGDARYAWADADGVTAYAHEWVNPHPEREIAALTLSAKPTAVDYELWALTVRIASKP